MLWYAQYYGVWNDYYGNYKWQKLPGGGEHRADRDWKAVYRLLQKMGERKYVLPETPYRQFPPIQIACRWEEKISFVARWKEKHGYCQVARFVIKLPVFYFMKNGNLVTKKEDDPDVSF